MLRPNCWNCGARVNGRQCQMCGAVQNNPYDEQAAPQAGRPARPAAPGAGDYAPNRERRYVPGGQPGEWCRHIEPEEEEYAPGPPDQQIDIAKSYGMRGRALSPGAPNYVRGGRPPSFYPEMLNPEPVEPAPSTSSRISEALSVPLATLGGIVAGAIGAAGWAFLPISVGRFVAIMLGLGVGLGVAFGARGHHDIGLSLFAGVLGVLSFCLTLYFRLSLEESHLLSAETNFFALPLDDFINGLGDYMLAHPSTFINFGLVPLAAMGTAYKLINRGRDGVS